MGNNLTGSKEKLGISKADLLYQEFRKSKKVQNGHPPNGAFFFSGTYFG